MQPVTRWFLAAVLTLAVGTELVAQGGVRIAFVDVQKVITDYKKTQEITENLENRVRQERTLLRQRAQALNQRIQQLEEIGDSDAEESMLRRLQEKRAIELEKVEIEIQQKAAVVLLEQELVEHMKKVYRETVRVAEAVARDRGYQAVLMVPDSKIQGVSRAEVSSEIMVRPVLWFDPSLDITAEVLRRLN